MANMKKTDFVISPELRAKLSDFASEFGDKNNRSIKLEISLRSGVPQYICTIGGWVSPYEKNCSDRCFAWGSATSEISFGDAITKAFAKMETEQ